MGGITVIIKRENASSSRRCVTILPFKNPSFSFFLLGLGTLHSVVIMFSRRLIFLVSPVSTSFVTQLSAKAVPYPSWMTTPVESFFGSWLGVWSPSFDAKFYCVLERQAYTQVFAILGRRNENRWREWEYSGGRTYLAVHITIVQLINIINRCSVLFLTVPSSGTYAETLPCDSSEHIPLLYSACIYINL